MDIDGYDNWKGESDPAYDEAYHGGSARIPLVGDSRLAALWEEVATPEWALRQAREFRAAARAYRTAGDKGFAAWSYRCAHFFLRHARALREEAGQ